MFQIQEDAWSVYAGCVGVSRIMLNGIGKLSSVSTTKLTSILPPYK